MWFLKMVISHSEISKDRKKTGKTQCFLKKNMKKKKKKKKFRNQIIAVLAMRLTFVFMY